MRILFLVSQFPPEFWFGTEQVTLNLAKAAQSEGHSVEVLTITMRDGDGWRTDRDAFSTTVIEGVPVTALLSGDQALRDIGDIANPKLARSVTRFLAKRPGFDIAHVMHCGRTAQATKLLADLRIPYLITIAELLDHQSQFGDLLLRASAVVAVSGFVAGKICKSHSELPMQMIPNGVDLLRFKARAPRSPVAKFTIGYLGPISGASGALLLAKAFAATGTINAELRMVGPTLETEVSAEIEQLSKTSAIRLEGPVPASEIPNVLASFDLLAVPSQHRERLGHSLNLGFAAGIPALVSNLGSLAEVVTKSGAGQVIDATDMGAWSDAIAQITRDPEQLAAWTRAIPLPTRIEEEAFLYSQIYRAIR